jgi:hypothetical protein
MKHYDIPHVTRVNTCVYLTLQMLAISTCTPSLAFWHALQGNMVLHVYISCIKHNISFSMQSAWCMCSSYRLSMLHVCMFAIVSITSLSKMSSQAYHTSQWHHGQSSHAVPSTRLPPMAMHYCSLLAIQWHILCMYCVLQAQSHTPIQVLPWSFQVMPLLITVQMMLTPAPNNVMSDEAWVRWIACPK